MSWLTPLGFLGLLGIIALIIIYIIKPNYQNKIISSTFVWKLSLKYRKKRIPINKLRNLLLFICQILVITCCALVLAHPFLEKDTHSRTDDKIIILDASASMMTESGGVTRFERAVSEIREYADDIISAGGRVSVIVADDSSEYLIQDVDLGRKAELNETLDSIISLSDFGCTYGTPDIDGAMKLAEKITQYSTGVEVLLYTDTVYIDDGDVTVKQINDPTDWNAAILDVRAILVDNSYRFEIDVACYGNVNKDIDVNLEIVGLNEDITASYVKSARCEYENVTTVVFSKTPDQDNYNEYPDPVVAYTFESLYVYITENDSFGYDNSFYLYGGTKQPLRIQYYSALPNNYFATALMVLRNQLSYRWDIELIEVKYDEIPAAEGFDFYIYEHAVPQTLPTDGVVLLANPDMAPNNAGFKLASYPSYAGGDEVPLKAGEAHPIMKEINAENITISRFTQITSHDGFTPLLYCDDEPVFIVKNDPDQKIAVMTFSLNYSNLPIILEFPLLMYNFLEYYTPSTITEHVFEINDTISFGSRSESVSVIGPYVNETVTEFPGTLKPTAPGTYTITQTPISGREVTDSIYVHVPTSESNINMQEDSLINPIFLVEDDGMMTDLLIYFALALVLLLFAEWWLHLREQF